MLTYGSLCTGLGADHLAFHSLGWECKWMSEVDEFCCAVLEAYWTAPNLGDVYAIKTPLKVNLIVGGTPCQSFSSANNHSGKGLDDKRGQLAIEFARIVNEVRPRWVVWENVSNVLYQDKGQSFSAITASLGERGYGWAYRILDIRGFGIPQMRRRVFLVGCSEGFQFAFASLFDKSSDTTNHEETTTKRKRDMARIDGWSSEIKPVRGIDCVPTILKDPYKVGVIIPSELSSNGKAFMRTLTVEECETLQGFPVGYTDVWYNGRPISDNVRKIALGNSFPSQVLYWLGQRIAFLDTLLDK